MRANTPQDDRIDVVPHPWGMAAYVALAAVSLGYLLMVAATPMVPGPGMPHDDLLFVRLSGEMLAGNWMGAYDNLTLVKGPGYPMWIAAVNWLGIPLQVSHGIVYLVAGWAIALGLGRLGVPAWLCLALFVFYLFVPGATTTVTMRILREGLYMPLTALLFGCMVWNFALRGAALWWRLIPAILLGFVLFWLWITREEQPWLYPGLAMFAIGLLLTQAGDRSGWRRGRMLGALVVLVVIAATTAGGIFVVGAINKRHYGVSDISEFRQSAQAAAYGAISRVIPARYVRYVVAPKDVREKLYAVSPAFAEMKPHLEGHSLNWNRHSCEMANVVPCDNEYRVSHFIWALRDAAALAGRFKSGSEVENYWRTVAAEIDKACDEGKLTCLPPRHTMAPPYRSEFLGFTLTHFKHLLILGITQAGLPRGELYAIGDTRWIDAIRQVSHAPLYPRGAHLFVAARIGRATNGVPTLTLQAPPERGQLLNVEWLPVNHDGTRDLLLETDCLAADCRLVVLIGDEVRLRLRMDELTAGATIDPSGLNLTVVQRERTAVPRAMVRQVAMADIAHGIFLRIYKVALPLLGALALGFTAFSLIRAIVRRRVSALFALTVVALATAVARLGLLAYMTAAVYPAGIYHYLSPFYPMCAAFIGLALIGGVRDLRDMLQRPARETPVA